MFKNTTRETCHYALVHLAGYYGSHPACRIGRRHARLLERIGNHQLNRSCSLGFVDHDRSFLHRPERWCV